MSAGQEQHQLDWVHWLRRALKIITYAIGGSDNQITFVTDFMQSNKTHANSSNIQNALQTEPTKLVFAL